MTDLSAESLPGTENVADTFNQSRRSRLGSFIVFGLIFSVLGLLGWGLVEVNKR